jgi:RND superfamily putative drug exporter
MKSLADFVIRHKRLVVAFWLIVLVGGIATSQTTTKRLSVDFSTPGQPGYETGHKILGAYGNGEQPPYVPVVTVASGTVAQHEADVAAYLAPLRSLPHARVLDWPSTHDPKLLTADGRSTYAYVYLPTPKSFNDDPGKAIKAALASTHTAGISSVLSGRNPLEQGNTSSSKGPGLVVEILFGGIGALAVLIFVFASFMALVPIVMAAFSILGTFLVLLPITYLSNVSFIVQFLIGLVGLGVAIDYSLLIVTRWREERAHGRENDEAVRVAVQTAGHAVLFSGVTVAIGLASLVVLPVPFLRSLGYGGMLIPLMSVAVVLTLLPAILSSIGPRIDYPRIRHENNASKFWTGWARLIVRRRWIAAGTAFVILGVLISPLTGIKIGESSASALATRGAAFQGLQTLEHGGIGTGFTTPIEVLVQGGDPAVVAAAAKTVPGVADAIAPTDPSWRQMGTAVVDVIPVNETVAGSSTKVVKAVKSTVSKLPGVVGVTGVGAIQIDYLHAVYGNAPVVFAVLSLLSLVLLMRAFRSVLLAVKAVILNLISLAATFGVMTWFWQDGHGSDALFGVSKTGAITFWLPIMVFAFLFGLSMDYEVFILTRVREEYDASGDTRAAIVEGVGRTGRLVTCAALILFLAFASLASGPSVDLKVMATGLGVGILLDATIVRALLVPSLVSLFGSWNWWLPDSVAKVLRVKQSHALAPRPGGTAQEPVKV